MREDPLFVSGMDVVDLIMSQSSSRDDIWTLQDFETQAEPSLVLGDLWHRVRASPIEISTGELCAALELAFQVINLVAERKESSQIMVIVDDGMIIDPNES